MALGDLRWDKTLSSRAGSNAGRGFRFQDAVATWFAITGWSGSTDWALFTPEGGDDLELFGGDRRAFVQIKSRREHLGDYAATTIAGFIRELWKRYNSATAKPTHLILALERHVANMSAPDGTYFTLSSKDAVGALLKGEPKAEALFPITSIVVVPSPQERSVVAIVERTDCAPVAAQIGFSIVLSHIGQLSDDNGKADLPAFYSASLSEIELWIQRGIEAADPKAVDEAIVTGLCEAVDFLTPINDDNFYLGVDVEPGHLAAGLVSERPAARTAIVDGLASKRNALVIGPSGSGKSAMMWDAAKAIRHTVRWFRVRRLTVAQVPVLRRLARSFLASARTPVGFVFDDVGKQGFDAWSEMAVEAGAEIGILLLGSVREEDVYQLDARSHAHEFRANSDPELAERIWKELVAKSKTVWEGWREPWERSGHLLLEYIYILTQGQRMSEVLATQVSARRKDSNRDSELNVLRVTAFAGMSGAEVDLEALCQTIGISPNQMERDLARLVEEHLVQTSDQGTVSGLHQLRCEALTDLCHSLPLPKLTSTFRSAVLSVCQSGLELVLTDSINRGHISETDVVDALIARLSQTRNTNELAMALRSLTTGLIGRLVEQWLALPSVKDLPKTWIVLGANFGIAKVDLSGLPLIPEVVEAAKDMTEIIEVAGGDPRHTFLAAMSEDLLKDLLSRTHDLEGLERILAALIGRPLPPHLREALTVVQPDLAAAPIADAARLLGTAARVDRSLAEIWVSKMGEDRLLDRLANEWPWASRASVYDDVDGIVVSADYWHVTASRDIDLNDAVVALCEALGAFCPRAAFAKSDAITEDGEIAGMPEFPMVTKRIPHQNLVPDALPEWNRRWMAAVSRRMAAKSQSTYLSDAERILTDVAETLAVILEKVFRGRHVADGDTDRLEDLKARNLNLTPPISPSSRLSSGREVQAILSTSPVQTVLNGLTGNILSRFASLPEGAPAYISWLSQLMKDTDDAAISEPWELIRDGPPPALGIVQEMLVSIRALTGEAHLRKSKPHQPWLDKSKKAQRKNAFHLAGKLAQNASTHRVKIARDELTAFLKSLDIDSRVYTRETDDGLPWPPYEVLVILPAVDVISAQMQVALMAPAIRQGVAEFHRLTVMAEVKGRALSRGALSGTGDKLFPLEKFGKSWIKYLGLADLSLEVSQTFARIADLSSEITAVDRLQLATNSRSPVEATVRADISIECAALLHTFNQAVDLIGETLHAQCLDYISDIKSGAVNHVLAQLATLRGEVSEAAIRFGAIVALVTDAEINSAVAG